LVSAYYVGTHGQSPAAKVAGMAIFLGIAIVATLVARRARHRFAGAGSYPTGPDSSRPEWVKRQISAVAGVALAFLVVVGTGGLVLEIPLIWPVAAFAVGCGVFLAAARVEQIRGRAYGLGTLCRLSGAAMFAGATIFMMEHFLKVLLRG